MGRNDSGIGRNRLSVSVCGRYFRRKGLSKRQQQAIAYIKTHGSISNFEYQVIAGISKSTATRELNYLKAAGVLYVEGKTGRGTFYRLK